MIAKEAPTLGAWQRMEQAGTRARARLGRRGSSLLAFGLVDVAVGWSLTDPLSRKVATATPIYRLLFLWVPAGTWAALWLAVAAVCFVQAWARDDRLAFGCAIGVKIVWALGLYGAWVVYDAPRAWTLAIVWLVLAWLVSVIAGWPEPPDPADWPNPPEQ